MTAAASILCMSIEQELLGITQHGTLVCADLEDPEVGTLVRHARAVAVLLSLAAVDGHGGVHQYVAGAPGSR